MKTEFHHHRRAAGTGRMPWIVLCLIGFLIAAAPRAAGQLPALERMPLAGPDAHQLAAGTNTSFSVTVPELDSQQRDAGGEWRGVVAVDVYGTPGGGNGLLTLQAVDPDTGAVLAAGTTGVDHPAAVHPWGVIFSSDTQRNRAFLAFDGHLETIWHSERQDGREEWIGVEFATPTRMTGLNYTPHHFSNSNGVARKFRVDIRQPGGAWQTVASGQRPTNSRTTLEVTFPGQDAVAIRFVIETDWSGNGFGSAARIELPGVPLDPVPVQAPGRAWLEIPPHIMSGLEGKSFELRVLNDSQNAVVIGAPRPRFDHAHLSPGGSLLNRGSGRFKLGAGLLGFDALYENNRSILTVMTVRPGTPAAEQQMVRGDVILAVRGRPLSFNNIFRGWEWFHHAHETIIGRETEAALQAGETTLPLTLLRNGVAVDIHLPLTRVAAFTTMNPTHDPESARMLDDCLGFLARTQRDNGSWSDCMIRTSFSALAMLSTGQPEHIDRARNAVRWAQARYKKPDDYGGLGFWYGAYAGLLYIEWHLATGDTSVLPNLEALREWVIGGAHMSRFGILALGHGTGGLPYSQGGLVAPTCHFLLVEAIAMRAGLQSAIWELILPYMERSWADPAQGGHGALGYFPAQRDNDQHWSRSGLFAMAAHLRGERPDMRDAMIQSMYVRHPWLRNSHAYGEPGGALGLLALNLAAPEIHAEVIRNYAWWFSLAWEPGYGLRYTTPHYGSTYMGEEDLINAAYALVIQSRRRTLHLTGLPQAGAPINWAVYDATGASDVSTLGALVASYTGHDDGIDYTLNGVPFQSGRIPGMPSSSLMSGPRQPQGVTGDYKAFLARSSYGSFTRTITLTGLTPGQRYLVQVWFADQADGGRSARLDRNTPVEVDLGDTGANQAGQYAIGTFMANATQQSFTVRTWQNGSETAWSQINGMQVRRMDTPFLSAPIDWTVHDTAGVSDVSTDGELVASFTGHNDGINYTLNGVTFQSARIPGMPSSSVISSARQPQGVTGDYKAFLARSSYGSNTRTIALTGLTIGERYLVQVWYADTPTGTSFERLDAGGPNEVDLLAGGANHSGQYALGTFTADATTRTFTARTWSSENSQSSWSQINGLQLRRIAPPVHDYLAWAANFPDADLSDPNADFDGDGLTNDQERIFGLDPTDPASVDPIVVPLDAATGTLSFTRRDPALTGILRYQVWYSTDLAGWQTDDDAVLTPGAVVDEVQTVAVKISDDLLDEPRLFLRISAEN